MISFSSATKAPSGRKVPWFAILCLLFLSAGASAAEVFSDGFESGFTGSWSLREPQCSELTELQCINSGDCTLILTDEISDEYACRAADGSCEGGFFQRTDSQEYCEAEPGCVFDPGICYCPPDLTCFCSGGPPPQCGENPA